MVEPAFAVSAGLMGCRVSGARCGLARIPSAQGDRHIAVSVPYLNLASRVSPGIELPGLR